MAAFGRIGVIENLLLIFPCAVLARMALWSGVATSSYAHTQSAYRERSSR